MANKLIVLPINSTIDVTFLQGLEGHIKSQFRGIKDFVVQEGVIYPIGKYPQLFKELSEDCLKELQRYRPDLFQRNKSTKIRGLCLPYLMERSDSVFNEISGDRDDIVLAVTDEFLVGSYGHLIHGSANTVMHRALTSTALYEGSDLLKTQSRTIPLIIHELGHIFELYHLEDQTELEKHDNNANGKYCPMVSSNILFKLNGVTPYSGEVLDLFETKLCKRCEQRLH